MSDLERLIFTFQGQILLMILLSALQLLLPCRDLETAPAALVEQSRDGGKAATLR